MIVLINIDQYWSILANIGQYWSNASQRFDIFSCFCIAQIFPVRFGRSYRIPTEYHWAPATSSILLCRRNVEGLESIVWQPAGFHWFSMFNFESSSQMQHALSQMRCPQHPVTSHNIPVTCAIQGVPVISTRFQVQVTEESTTSPKVSKGNSGRSWR